MPKPYIADLHEGMKGQLTFMSDGRYLAKSFATDNERASVCAYDTRNLPDPLRPGKKNRQGRPVLTADGRPTASTVRFLILRLLDHAEADVQAYHDAEYDP